MNCKENSKLEYFNVPNEWNVKTVEELVKEEILDKPLDGNHGGIHPTQKDFVDEGIPFIMASDIKEGIIDYTNCKYITLETSQGLKKGFAREGDVLLTHKATIGRTAIVQDITSPYIVLTPQVTYYRVLNRHKLNNKYLKYYFMSKAFSELFNAWAQGGSTRAYLGITAQQKLPIIIPRIEEQKAIANILSSLDEKIELNNQMNKTLEEMAQALFKRWFVDFEFPNENGEPYKSSGGEMVDSELGMIPKGWEVKSLKEIFTFRKGKKPKKIEDKKIHDGYKNYLTIDVLNRTGELYATGEKLVESDIDDIMMVMDGASSGTIYTGMDGIVGSTLAKLEINQKKLKVVIYQFLKYQEEYIKSHLTGSAIPHTDKEYVYSFKIALPNECDLYEVFNQYANKIRLNKENNQVLKIIRDTLLPKLMSGEIRVIDLQN